MSLLPPDPAPPPMPEQTTAEGPWGGPSFRYRGAEIHCLKGGHVCGLRMEGHPLDGQTFGVPGSIYALVDLWLDEKRLPDYMRTLPKG
jgi:hypothetical protein